MCYPPEEDWNEANRGHVHGESLVVENEVRTTANGDLIPPDMDYDYSLEDLETE